MSKKTTKTGTSHSSALFTPREHAILAEYLRLQHLRPKEAEDPTLLDPIDPETWDESTQGIGVPPPSDLQGDLATNLQAAVANICHLLKEPLGPSSAKAASTAPSSNPNQFPHSAFRFSIFVNVNLNVNDYFPPAPFHLPPSIYDTQAPCLTFPGVLCCPRITRSVRPPKLNRRQPGRGKPRWLEGSPSLPSDVQEKKTPERKASSWCTERTNTMSTKKTNTKTKTTPTAPAATQATKSHPGVTIRWLTPEEAAEKYGGGFSFVGSRPFRPTSTNPPTPTPDQGGK